VDKITETLYGLNEVASSCGAGPFMVEQDQNTAVVMCPGCNRPMREVQQRPIAVSDGLVDVTFTCEVCHMHTIRIMKRD
jgi:hypothetical protein